MVECEYLATNFLYMLPIIPVLGFMLSPRREIEKLSKVLNILQVSRAEYWPGYVLYGVMWLKFFHALNWLTAILVSIFSILVSAYGSLINVFSDIQYDARNPSKSYLSRTVANNLRFYTRLLMFYLAGMVALHLLFCHLFGSLAVDIIATVIFVTATIAATLYSVGIRFKEKGILSYPILGYAIFGSYILYFAVFTGYPLSSAILLSVGYAMVGVGATNVTNYIGDYYFDKRATLNTAVVQIGVYPSLFLGCIMIIIGTVIAGSVSRVFYTLFLTLIPYLVSVIMAWEAKEWDVMNLASPISWLLMAVIPWMA